MSLDETMDLPAVAAYLGARSETVAQLARKGELPGAQIGKGWIFLREDVIGFLRNRIAQETETRRAMLRQEKIETHPDNSAELHAVVVDRVRARRRELPVLPELTGYAVTRAVKPDRFPEDSRSA